MPYDPYKALYLHIPFCVQRCNYCDFCTNARDFESKEIDEYVEFLVSEIRKNSKEEKLGQIKTIYIGGGTPSFIGVKRLSSILYALSMSLNLDKVDEFSMEANPESININLIKDIWALGVNRLSIGVQSFDDDILKMLGRSHDSKKAICAINITKERFENVSIDLMCGIPGQSIKSFEDSLMKAIEIGVNHISIYPLSIEHNTVFYKWKAQGRIDDTDDDVQAQHMEIAAKILEKHGYIHYEVASFCKSGFECRHNLSYWQSKPYLGLGLSATTMTQNSERRMRMTDKHIDDDLNYKQMIAEDLMLSARTKYGASKDLINLANAQLPDFNKTLKKLEELGLIAIEDNVFYPTKKGWLCGNEIYSAFLDLSK